MNVKQFYRYVFVFLLSVFVFTGCGSDNGGGVFDDNGNPVGNESGTAYSIENGNHALMGPLKNATVKVYKLTDLETPIEETQTGSLGKFDVSLNGVADDELLLVTISGGMDVDVNDDGILDATPTENKGTIHGFAKASELKSSSVNVTLLSEIVYQYTKHLIGEIHPDDLEQALDTIASTLFKSSELNATYSDIGKFNPLNNDLKSKMSINYADLLKENSLANSIHTDVNTTELANTLNELLKSKLSFNRNDLIHNPTHCKLSLIPGIKTDFSADNADIYVKTESNESKLIAFVPVDSNVTFTATPNEEMKIIDWDGCNKISTDKTQCTVSSIQESKTIMPRIQYKESIYADNVKDLTGYVVIVNDNNYTVTLDLDTDATKRTFIESIVTDDIIIKRDGDIRFFRKVVSVIKVDDYNYIIDTEDMSFLEVYKQGGMSLNRNLTHEDLAEDIDTINRSLRSQGAVLLPPKHKNDDEFTIVYLDKNMNRSLLDNTGMEINVPIWKEGDDEISIKGSITFKVKTNFDYNSNWYGGLESMRFNVTTTTSGQLSLVGKASITKKEERVSLLGYESNNVAKSLKWNLPSGWLLLRVNLRIFAGIEGEIAGEVDIGAERKSTSVLGFNLYDGNANIINRTNATYGMIGGFPTIKASIGGFLAIQPGIEALHIGKLGVELKSGVYIDSSVSPLEEKSEGKVVWKTSLSPRFDMLYPLNNFQWARDKEKKVNETFKKYSRSLTFSKELYTIVDADKRPALLFVDSPLMKETVYSDVNGISKRYTLTLKNIGEEKLKWKIEKSGDLYTVLDISKTSGELEKDETVDVVIDFSFNGVDDLVGVNMEGLIKVINETNNLGSIEQKVTLEVLPRLSTPSNLNQVYFSGISTTFINFDLPDYTWDEYTGYYDDRGFKIFVAKEVNGECGTDYQLFHSIDVINNHDEIFTNKLTKVNLKEKMERLHLDYGKRYCFKLSSYLKGYSSESTPTAQYYIPKLGSIKTSIKDRNGNPIVNARVHLTSTSDNSVADGDGNVIFENLIPGTYLMTVNADGFINTPSRVVVREGEETLFEGIRVIEEDLEGTTGIVSGKIIDAVHSSVIDGVTIEVRAGNSNISGEILTSTTTDSNGQYSLTLPTGNYTFKISKNGYIGTKLNVLSIGNETTTQDLSLSPVLSAGEMRIVLRWGDNPSDLDSHLVKKTNGVENYHIYYSNKVSGNDSLDRDDTDSVGPETVTIANVDTASVYTYYVYNYSHNNNTELKNSSATIDISYGNYSDRRSVPNENGYYWKVFEIVNGEVVLCTTGCVQDDTSTLIRSIDRNLEKDLFRNLPSKN